MLPNTFPGPPAPMHRPALPGAPSSIDLQSIMQKLAALLGGNAPVAPNSVPGAAPGGPLMPDDSEGDGYFVTDPLQQAAVAGHAFPQQPDLAQLVQQHAFSTPNTQLLRNMGRHKATTAMLQHLRRLRPHGGV